MKSAFQPRATGPGRALAITAMTAVLLLAGCGGAGSKDKASQTAAKVNKEEITVHQINFVLQQQRGLKPEQADAAGKQILERLIDQELAVQKAEDLKLDRDPRVVQQLDAAKREIIARAYVEKAGEAAAKPTTEAIKQYYDEHPALFKERRIYSIQEVTIEATPDQVPALREHLQGAKSINEFVDYLKSSGFKFTGNQAVRAAEQLPLNMVDAFAKMKDGQAVLSPTATGAQVIVLAGSRSEPVDEVRARPAIEQFLWNDAKRKLLDADMKSLRAAAKIEYVGKFAEAAASAPAAAVAPQATPASAAASAAQNLDANAINKGLSGLK